MSSRLEEREGSYWSFSYAALAPVLSAALLIFSWLGVLRFGVPDSNYSWVAMVSFWAWMWPLHFTARIFPRDTSVLSGPTIEAQDSALAVSFLTYSLLIYAALVCLRRVRNKVKGQE